MQYLTTIDNKVKKEYELTSEELKFLYELDYQIEGFGYSKDPRIEEIRSKRNIIDDLNKVFASVTSIKGDLDLRSLTSAEGLTLPENIGGSLNLNGLILPQNVGRHFILPSLTSVEGLTLPQSIGGDLDLSRLSSAKDLKLPQGFPLEKLIVPNEIIEEIKANPSFYYQTDELEEK